MSRYDFLVFILKNENVKKISNTNETGFRTSNCLKQFKKINVLIDVRKKQIWWTLEVRLNRQMQCYTAELSGQRVSLLEKDFEK